MRSRGMVAANNPKRCPYCLTRVAILRLAKTASGNVFAFWSCVQCQRDVDAYISDQMKASRLAQNAASVKSTSAYPRRRE